MRVCGECKHCTRMEVHDWFTGCKGEEWFCAELVEERPEERDTPVRDQTACKDQFEPKEADRE